MDTDLAHQRVLVVGGGGFIGQHIVARLRAARAEVIVMDVFSRREGPDDLEWIVGSAADQALLASAVAGCQTVIFLANSSLPGSANSDLAAEGNAHVGVTVKAAEICEEQGVTRFIFASSGGTVYGHDSDVPLQEDAPTAPRNAYGVSKLSIEHYLRLRGQLRRLDTLSLRISNPYGEGQRAHRAQGFIAAAMQHGMTGETMSIWGDGSVERDFVYVGDVADAFVRACAYPGGQSEINIGAGRSTSLLDILGAVETALARKIPVRFEANRAIDVKKNVLDIGRARTALDWQPQTELGTGLARTAAWWLARSRTA